MEEKTITWNGPEYINNQKTTDWYFAISIITLALVITSLLFQNIILGIILLLSGIIILIFAKKSPSEIDFSISNNWVIIGSSEYDIKNLKIFWIKESTSNFYKLLIKNDSLINSILIIPLPKKYLEKAREILSENLEEKPIVDSALDSFLDRLGF